MNITLKRFATGARRITTIVVTIAAAAVISACNNNQDDYQQHPTPNPTSISFASPSLNTDWNAGTNPNAGTDRNAGSDRNTRAIETTTGNLLKIGVYGYSHPKDVWSTTPEANRKPDYFLNKAVVKNGSSWVYDGAIKYWPDSSKRISFFAYAPYSDVNSNIALAPIAATPVGSPTITFTQETNVTRHVDLVWSNSINNGGTAPFAAVQFPMKHALTRIGFSAKLGPQFVNKAASVHITQITIGNVIGKATLDLQTNMAANPWRDNTNRTTLTSYSIFPNAGIIDSTFAASIPADFTARNVTSSDGFMMIVPQTLGTTTDALPTQVVVTYVVTDTSTHKSFPAQKVTFKIGGTDSNPKVFMPSTNPIYEITITDVPAGISLMPNFELGETDWIDHGETIVLKKQ